METLHFLLNLYNTAPTLRIGVCFWDICIVPQFRGCALSNHQVKLKGKTPSPLGWSQISGELLRSAP